jgi:hypothetical protein
MEYKNDKYRDWGKRGSAYSYKYPELLIEHMSKGGSLVSFRAAYKIPESTFFKWLREKPEFAEARDIGRDLSQAFWEKIGLGLATDQIKGNASAWIFTMKNRFKWVDNTNVNVGGQAGNPLQIAPVNLDVKRFTTEELLKIEEAVVDAPSTSEE